MLNTISAGCILEATGAEIGRGGEEGRGGGGKALKCDVEAEGTLRCSGDPMLR